MSMIPGRVLLTFSLAALALTSGAGAQDFPDVQRFTNKVLFASQDADLRRRAAEQRRVDELGQRAERQEIALQAQAASVRQLGGELQLIRDERQLIDLADGFDAAMLAGRWPLVRSFLADAVTVDIAGAPGTGDAPLPADSFVAGLSGTAAKGGVLPRSNQRARIDGEHATLMSQGYAWGRPVRSGETLERRAGEYEYGFVRTPEGWKIDRLIFRASTPS